MSPRVKELRIVQTTVATHHAQANPVDRCSKEIKKMVSMLVEKDHRNWDIHLQEFAFALNTSVQALTQVTPAFLNFGRNPKRILSLCISIDTAQSQFSEFVDQQLWTVNRHSAQYDLVKKHLQIAYLKQSRYYNRTPGI